MYAELFQILLTLHRKDFLLPLMKPHKFRFSVKMSCLLKKITFFRLIQGICPRIRYLVLYPFDLGYTNPIHTATVLSHLLSELSAGMIRDSIWFTMEGKDCMHVKIDIPVTSVRMLQCLIIKTPSSGFTTTVGTAQDAPGQLRNQEKESLLPSSLPICPLGGRPLFGHRKVCTGG